MYDKWDSIVFIIKEALTSIHRFAENRIRKRSRIRGVPTFYRSTSCNTRPCRDHRRRWSSRASWCSLGTWSICDAIRGSWQGPARPRTLLLRNGGILFQGAPESPQCPPQARAAPNHYSHHCPINHWPPLLAGNFFISPSCRVQAKFKYCGTLYSPLAPDWSQKSVVIGWCRVQVALIEATSTSYAKTSNHAKRTRKAKWGTKSWLFQHLRGVHLSRTWFGRFQCENCWEVSGGVAKGEQQRRIKWGVIVPLVFDIAL